MLKRAALGALACLYFTSPGAHVCYAAEPAFADVDIVAWGQMGRGVHYELGRHVVQSYVKAATWYYRAAERGHAPAQNSLARLYEFGQGVPRDPVVAHMWYSLAAARGHPGAALNRDALAGRMTPAELEEAERLARDWRPTLD